MLYILDTHICQLAMAKNPLVMERIARADAEADTIATTIISLDEAVSGWLPICHDGKRLAKRAWAYEQLLATFTYYRGQLVLPYTPEAASLLATLKKSFQHIGLGDLSIAAIALTLNGIVVAQNFVDFQRIPGLQIEDWTR
jgi:tRNA(fMet)-specific endonuclease VapC